MGRKRATTVGKANSVNTESIPPLSDRRAMEGMLSGLVGPQRGSAVAQAQNVMYEAWEADSAARRIALARKALELSPDCADAYVLLAEESARSLDEATEFYRKGVAAGERALGPQTFKEEVGYFWGLLETRPYMRARCGLAQCLWQAGHREEAVGHYRELLRLNPNDNQGIRDVLATCLLELGQHDELATLLKRYEQDGSAVWAYTRVLLAFRQDDESAKACQLLTQAKKTNRHVPAFLLGARKLPKDLPEYIGFGDENEAVAYVADNAEVWRNTPGALEWLQRNI